MELLLVGAGLLTYTAVSEDLGSKLKDVYPRGEEDPTKGAALRGYPGMDRTNLLVNRSQPNFPTSLRNNVAIENPASGRLNERIDIDNPAFVRMYASNYRLAHDNEHPLLDVDKMRYPYPTRRMFVRVRGGHDDLNILGQQFNQ
jgi:hypothetical protein